MIEVALVVGIGLATAKLIWLAVEPGGAVSPDIPVRSVVQPPQGIATNISVDTSRLLHENPFGAASALVADIPDAPETSLNLKLRGVRASSEEAGGIALITTPDNRTAAYSPGEAILEGVTLHRIYGDRVTLRKGGQTEALTMEGGAGLLSVLTTPGQPDPESNNSATGSTSARIARADLMSSITIDPVHHGQEFVGYRIGSRGDADVMTRAGLQPGDVVVGLDGADINDVPPAELARKFSDPNPVRLKIDRDGKTIDHTLAPEEAR
ncbi:MULTISPECIES: type II secretion system protein N [unclassified Hyphomonas]|uniref:type II secretion system protein N n=1 Tax=unclassified Hyphomonas TaxID=2630699 RepID=UPI0025C553BA|nr:MULTISPECIES: type II secretion system protein N [unclassified Hyphomonas]